MGATRSTGWVVGTVLAVLAIFAATWFLVAGPRFADASETATAAQDTEDLNDLLELRVAELAEQFTHLDEYQAELAALRTEVPANEELTAYLNSVNALAEANALTITELAPAVPVLVEFEEPVAAPAETTDATGATDTTADAEAGTAATGTTATETTATNSLDGFAYVQLAIKVKGPYANVAAFLDAIQTANTRIFVPTTVDSVSAKADAETQPPTADGDLEFTIVGNLYVLQEATVDSTAAPEDGTSEPLPSSEVNPFESLAGIPR